MARQEVPVTPAVLNWAISQSGFLPGEVADRLRLSAATLYEWARGDACPSLGELKRLAKILRRPLAMFFLPEPPQEPHTGISFRSPPDAGRKAPNPTERRYIREASRLQRALSWLRAELDQRTQLVRFASTDDPATAAHQCRALLSVSTNEQASWPSASAAFDVWRDAFERVGVYVFSYSLGPRSCRGFSLWDEHAPIVAVNTHWNDAARVFTLFHELGHLVTRSDSVCMNPAQQLHAAGGDSAERWCERFAASTLVPASELRAYLRDRIGIAEGAQVRDLRVGKAIANRFNVSLRAAVLRLIELGAADWDLYDSIPPVTDAKPHGGGGQGRVRREIREDSLGPFTGKTFIRGVHGDLISRYDALTYLDVSDSDFEKWEADTPV